MNKVARPAVHLTDFPSQIVERVRWNETDAFGHVNNLVFANYCESGRVEILREVDILGISRSVGAFIARLEIDYLAQLTWPGMVEIGTRVEEIGRTSITFKQGIFQNGICAAEAKSILVQVKDGVPEPIDDATRAAFAKFMLS